MIEFSDYRKYYGNALALSVPRLQLAAGIYWLKGVNGSGKTTLLKSIAGLVPFQGQISVEGVDIRRQRVAYRQVVNYAEAEPLYPAFLTGNDLARFYMETKSGSNEQFSSLAATFGCAHYLDNKTGTYSSGMVKKLSLVLGFIGAPKLVLLDEPLITLDQQSVQVLKQVILDSHAMGISFIITSHQEIDFPGFTPARLLVADKQLMVV